MIHYDEIEIGTVYKPTIRLWTTDRSEEIDLKSCFTIMGKSELKMMSKKDIRCRMTIFYNGKMQVLILKHHLPFEKVV